MKRKILFLFLFALIFSLLSCFDLTSTSTVLSSTDTMTDATTSTTVNSVTDSTTISTIISDTTVNTAEDVEPFVPTNYSLLQDELDYVGIPSIGSPKVLVFAVDFSDYPSTSQSITTSDIDLAFNGTSEQLTYESVNSYYSISSYGNLNLTADVYGYYRADYPSSYYADEYDKYWATDEFGNWLYPEDEVTPADSDLIYEVLTYYDSQIDYSDYDYNNDGYIDGVYIIYTHPVSYYSGQDLWWAYMDFDAYTDLNDYYGYEVGDPYYEPKDVTLDGVKPNCFVWAGTEFFEEGIDNINARTVIHETGHMLGLEDYYDYYDGDAYNSGGLGGADMMDSAMGDHNAFSKLLLGWIQPIVIEGSATVDLSAFEDSGNVLLITDHWNGTIFDEYILVSFYTPTGLNEEDQYYLFSNYGVEIFHVSAAIDNGYNEYSYYYSIFNNNNTDSVHKLIKIIEADMSGEIDSRGVAENSDLFDVGDVFNQTVYPNYKWYNNQLIDFTIAVTARTTTQVRIRIEFDS